MQTPEFLCFDDPLQCSPCHLNVRDLKTNEPMAVSMEPCEAKNLDFEIIPFLIVVKSSQDCVKIVASWMFKTELCKVYF